MVLLVGENGAGKSTLLRCLAGWERLRAGEITFEGTTLEKLSSKKRSRMAFVADVPAFYDDLTAYEHVELLGRANRWEDARWNEADRLLERFGIASFCDQYPQTFSRGMRQKLACSLALALEPTSATILEDEIAQASRKGCAVLMSCHHELETIVPTRVLKLDNGTLSTCDVANEPFAVSAHSDAAHAER